MRGKNHDARLAKIGRTQGHPQCGGFERRVVQHVVAIAGDQEVDDFPIRFAGFDQVAHFAAQIFGQIGPRAGQ